MGIDQMQLDELLAIIPKCLSCLLDQKAVRPMFVRPKGC